jgi:predicted dienelactone hydrolase
MRFFEIMIPIILALTFFWPHFRREHNPVYNVLPVLNIALLAAHLLSEGWRWQMIPLYLLAIIAFLLSFPKLFSGKGKEPLPRPGLVRSLGLGLLLIVSVALPTLLPVPAIPQPGGPLTVGTASFELVDESRSDPYAPTPTPRRLMIQAWYPALPSPGDKIAPWMDSADLFAPSLAGFINMPPWFLDHLVYAQTNSYQNAAPDRTNGPYPLILFSHGWNGFREQNTFQMQELASRGYVVVAVQHTYGAILTVFPDGTLAPNNPTALFGPGPEDDDEAARQLVAQWATDIGYTLDYLSEWNREESSSIFSGLLDLERVGMMGHSTGGGAAIQFCANNPRCKAGLGMDAFMTPVAESTLDSGIQQPFLYLFSQAWADRTDSKNNLLFNRFYANLPQSAPVITLLGTSHFDFSDLPALSPLAAQLGLKGPLNGARVQQLINTYSVAFFDSQLKDIPSSLFDGPQSDYPEMRYEQR